MTTVTHALADIPTSRADAAAIERAEARAWIDAYAAAPASFRAAVGMDTTEIAGACVIRWAATGRRYFSRAIGLGVGEPVMQEGVDAVLAWFERHDITMFLLQSFAHCEPADYEQWLADRGLEQFDAQDRIVRDDSPLATAEHAFQVERVTAATATEWSHFIQHVYRLDTADWLPRLIGRLGWHVYIARSAGQIVAARSMYVGPDNQAWLGMDAPVPGLGTDDYEPDAALSQAIVADGLRLGVRRFLADIEAPSDAMDTPAYVNFGRLGFTRPYTRKHWAKVS